MKKDVKHYCVSNHRYCISVIENDEKYSVPVIEIECEPYADHWQCQRIGQYCLDDLKRSINKVGKYIGRRKAGKEKNVPPSPIQELVLWEVTEEFTWTLQRTKSESGKVHYSYTFYDTNRKEIPVIRLVNVEIAHFVDDVLDAIKCMENLIGPDSNQVPKWLRHSTAALAKS